MAVGFSEGRRTRDDEVNISTLPTSTNVRKCGSVLQSDHICGHCLFGNKIAETMTIYKSYVNGEWVDSASGKTAENINPSNVGDVIGTIQMASREEARSAV